MNSVLWITWIRRRGRHLAAQRGEKLGAHTRAHSAAHSARSSLSLRAWHGFVCAASNSRSREPSTLCRFKSAVNSTPSARSGCCESQSIRACTSSLRQPLLYRFQLLPARRGDHWVTQLQTLQRAPPIDCTVPAAMDSFRVAREVFKEQGVLGRTRYEGEIRANQGVTERIGPQPQVACRCEPLGLDLISAPCHTARARPRWLGRCPRCEWPQRPRRAG